MKTADQVLCNTLYTGGFLATYYTRGDCVRVDFAITDTPVSEAETVTASFVGPDGGAPFKTVNAARRSGDNNWRVVVDTDTTTGAGGLTWPAGKLSMEVVVSGDTAPAGTGEFFLNALGADIGATAPVSGSYAPGDAIPVTGNLHQLNDIAGGTQSTGVAATFKVRVKDPTGTILYTTPSPITAASNGNFSATIPAQRRLASRQAQRPTSRSPSSSRSSAPRTPMPSVAPGRASSPAPAR